jgi:hypothetical protein
MRFAWIVLILSILICAPFIGCSNKEAPSGGGLVTPSKKKKPRGPEQPPFPEPPP